MTLLDTIEALEQNHIVVALDVGVHKHCDINSNCPMAVELRRVVTESGITLEQLQEGFVAGGVEQPPALEFDPANYNGMTSITVAGREITIDFTPIMVEQMGNAYTRKVRELDAARGGVQSMGNALYRTYLAQIVEARKSATLPQLKFPIADLIKAGCVYSSDGKKYIFVFPRAYNPEHIVHNGFRYKISAADIKKIKRNVLLVYNISKEYKLINTYTLSENGSGFEHYHGTDHNNCWGHVVRPARWDGRLKTLSDLTIQLMGAIQTVNRDSILKNEPSGMPHIDNLFSSSKKLGKEGTLEKEKPPNVVRLEEVEVETGEIAVDAPPDAPQAPIIGWGRGRARDTGTNTVTITPEAMTDRQRDSFARFGMVTDPTDMDTICQLCGERYGLHRGVDTLICPRDYEMNRRFNLIEVLYPSNPTCNLCGGEYGAHYGRTCPRDLPAPTTGTPTERRLAQFGTADPDMGMHCVLCGQTYGSHRVVECLANY